MGDPCAGWLYKSGAVNKSLKRRWFACDGGTMTISYGKTMAGAKKGAINLSGCTKLVEGFNGQFLIITPSRSWDLHVELPRNACAANYATSATWLAFLAKETGITVTGCCGSPSGFRSATREESIVLIGEAGGVLPGDQPGSGDDDDDDDDDDDVAAAEWEENVDDSGRAYYVNSASGESRWERPAPTAVGPSGGASGGASGASPPPDAGPGTAASADPAADPTTADAVELHMVPGARSTDKTDITTAVAHYELSDGGKILSSLEWAANSSVALVPATRFDHFRGTHKFFRVDLPPHSSLVVELAYKPGAKLSLYAMSFGVGAIQMPPHVHSCVGCEKKYPFYAPGHGPPPETGKRSITLNAVLHPYSALIAVCGAAGVHNGAFSLSCELHAKKESPLLPDGAVPPPLLIEVADGKSASVHGDLADGGVRMVRRRRIRRLAGARRERSSSFSFAAHRRSRRLTLPLPQPPSPIQHDRDRRSPWSTPSHRASHSCQPLASIDSRERIASFPSSSLGNRRWRFRWMEV